MVGSSLGFVLFTYNIAHLEALQKLWPPPLPMHSSLACNSFLECKLMSPDKLLVLAFLVEEDPRLLFLNLFEIIGEIENPP